MDSFSFDWNRKFISPETNTRFNLSGICQNNDMGRYRQFLLDSIELNIFRSQSPFFVLNNIACLSV